MASPQMPLFLPLDLLQDPPEDYLPDQFAPDAWRVNEWRAIVDYHGYGFVCELPKSRADLISVFKKISYSTRGGKRARCTGDVGPGLLKEGLLGKFGMQIPYASWYVTETDIQSYFKIPSHLLRAPVPRSNKPNNSIQIKTKSGCPRITFVGSNQDRGKKTLGQGTTAGSIAEPDKPVIKGTLGCPEKAGTNRSELQNIQETLQTASDRRANTASNTVSSREIASVTESIKRNLIDSAYRSLYRHEAAFPLTPESFIDATSSDDLLEAVSLNVPTSATIRLMWKELTQYAINPNGQPARYYGKGPVWAKNSCWMDSVIVAGMLLQAGLTIADRADEVDWEERLDTVGRGFLDTLSMDWNFFNREDSIAHRDQFRELYTDDYNSRNAQHPITMDESHYANPFWDSVTKDFHQFRYLGQDRSVCPCWPNRSVSQQLQWVKAIQPRTLADDDGATTLQTLVQRWFLDTRRCSQCKQQSRATSNVVHGELPLRLVLQTYANNHMPADHTDDISFEYDTATRGKEETSRSKAIYQWLEGVYYSAKKKHFRLFWTDDKRGQANSNRIRIYDGLLADGAIIGNLRMSQEKAKKVTDPEWTTKSAPLLFYERIVLPTDDALRGARKAILDVLDAKQEGVYKPTWAEPAISRRRQDVYRKSLQPFVFQDAGLRVTRTIGPTKVAVEVKDLPPPPTKAALFGPKQDALSPSKAGHMPKIVGTGKAEEVYLLSDSDDGPTAPIPTPGPTKADMFEWAFVNTGSDANEHITLDSDTDQEQPTPDLAVTKTGVSQSISVSPGDHADDPIDILSDDDNERWIPASNRGAPNKDVTTRNVTATPPQPLGAQTRGTKRKGPNSSIEQSDRADKQPSALGLLLDESTANVVPLKDARWTYTGRARNAPAGTGRRV